MSQKNMKMVMIVAIIFGIAGFGYGYKANNDAQHPARSDAYSTDVPDYPNIDQATKNKMKWCWDRGIDPSSRECGLKYAGTNVLGR